MTDAFLKPQEYSTTRKDGRPISKKQAAIKYGKILEKNIDASQKQAMRLGFAQLIVSGIGIGIGVATNNTDVALLVNGVSTPFLFFQAYQMFESALNSKKLLKQLENGEIDPYKKLKRIEKYYEEQIADGKIR